MLTIAIDYDNTWTAAPDLFRDFACSIKALGGRAIIATNRGPDWIVGEVAGLPVVYANGRPKRTACREAGYRVDVWVDDLPHLVDLGAGHPLAASLGLP